MAHHCFSALSRTGAVDRFDTDLTHASTASFQAQVASRNLCCSVSQFRVINNSLMSHFARIGIFPITFEIKVRGKIKGAAASEIYVVNPSFRKEMAVTKGAEVCSQIPGEINQSCSASVSPTNGGQQTNVLFRFPQLQRELDFPIQ